MELRFIDYLVLGLYSVYVLAVGYALKGQMRTSEDFFLSGRSLPSWITGLAFMAANLGALEVMGMSANGAKYGMLTNHFYWVGAIPAMVFLALFMMPFYYSSRIRSVPEYLKLRFDEKTRGLNAISFAVMTVMMSGINMYAMALVLNLLLGWSIHASIVLSAAIVLVYIFFGGLTSSIYNEVLQFFLIVFGLLPLAFLGLSEAGGFEGLAARLPEGFVHTWSARSWDWDSSSPSATGAPTSWSSSGPWPRRTSSPRNEPRSSRRSRRCSSPCWSSSRGWSLS
jgi:SSS family solute:Na+ symporter